MTPQQTFTATVPQALDVALKHYQAGKLQEAAQLYCQVLQVDPRNVDALRFLGAIHNQLGKSESAIAYLSEAVRLKPDYAEAHNSLANALGKQGRLDEAVASYRYALKVKPDYADAYNNLGSALKIQGKPEEAVACYQQALRLKPNYADAHYNLGIVFMELGRVEDAIASYKQAVRLKPDHADAHNNLGAALNEQERMEEAIASFQEAVRVKPSFAQAHHNLGSAYKKQGRLEDAIASFQQAVRLNPDLMEAQNDLGAAFVESGRLAEGLIHLGHALRLKPDHAFAHNNLGIALADLGRLDEAVADFQEAIRLQPDCSGAHGNLGMTWLLQGKFELGWPEYEWRFHKQEAALPHLPQPAWDGSPLADRTILLRTEQGLGDTFHFIRYAALVKERAGRVLVECPKFLMPILSSCPGIDRLVTRSPETMEPFDVHAPLLSVPGLLGTTLATVPANVPYMFADPKLVEQWRHELRFSEGFKIGIAWHGNPKQDQSRGVGRRSIPLAEFAPVGKLPGVSLFSLQKGPGTEQLPEATRLFSVMDLGSWIDGEAGAFMQTAAVIKCLDLVVTSDTSIAHLAGAMGAPVWVALPFAPEWRWMRDREDSVWYPTMRLFRQSQPGNWRPVFERMANEVSKLLRPLEASSPITIEVSPGELLDKITILEIKAERVTNAEKLRNVQGELEMLRSVSKRSLPATDQLEALTAKLKAVNTALWEIEDGVRSCEAQGKFDARFVELARSVYQRNDERAALKRAVNKLLGSRLIEEKSYTNSSKG